MGRHGAIGVGPDVVLIEADGAFHGKLLDEARYGFGAVVRGQRLTRAREG